MRTSRSEGRQHLGAQQHGHIAAVGYDLYSKLLAEAVRELAGGPTPPRSIR